MSHATPEHQLNFISYLQRIFVEGDFVATYKFALLHAIADICIARPMETDRADDFNLITLDELANKFIELYWRHSLPYGATDSAAQVLKQSQGKQAGILQLLSEIRAAGVVNHLELTVHSDWPMLHRKVKQIIKAGPLWRLQIMAGNPECLLYPHSGGNSIRLNPGIVFCMRRFYDLVISLARTHWIQMVRELKGNQLLIGQDTGLNEFLFGSNRQSLGNLVPVLADIQHGNCFYCQKAIRSGAEVDHFIPWSRYPVDLGHNFVLAHKDCNQNKRALLAAEIHRDAWFEQNIIAHSGLIQQECASFMAADAQRSVAITTWAYQQAHADGSRLWLGINQFVDFNPSYASYSPG
ncbi:HNH endonuclease [Shewanella algae]|uniref:HNH endonuclease n=1 Tax=Shewanella algae TaxID=38313 RepID=UPI001AAF105D|nr:HNH endonuclease domain-containing protein [Shewanella algae]MBO2660797.1 HNH endonuclease [Shewanella algae]MCL1055316.1 HNH endonuclease [Shewanella algae]